MSEVIEATIPRETLIKRRGFGSMSAEKRKAIARKGGLAVSQNRLHMSVIGSKGGIKSGEVRSQNRKQ